LITQAPQRGLGFALFEFEFEFGGFALWRALESPQDSKDGKNVNVHTCDYVSNLTVRVPR